MNKINEKTLDSLLYIDHDGNCSDKQSENINLYTFILIYDILYDEKMYKKTKYYKSEAFKTMCNEIRNNLPKRIYIKDKNGDYIINTSHKKNNLYSIMSHSLKYILLKLGF